MNNLSIVDCIALTLNLTMNLVILIMNRGVKIQIVMQRQRKRQGLERKSKVMKQEGLITRSLCFIETLNLTMNWGQGVPSVARGKLGVILIMMCFVLLGCLSFQPWSEDSDCDAEEEDKD